ncbi:hypothetical protein [Flavobacterium oreochromis]|uniref:Uncharacterized protein n=1 Tax=Flavobacterium columnare TaxID=996 RepID=A0A246GAP8_9FLAO|nr:hypothetical protein [Flavobacterium oreochromis]OWP77211.1 hypothetical protein BWK62_08105 [Flavobacterium oreochromis]
MYKKIVLLLFGIQNIFAQENIKGKVEVDLIKKDSLMVVNRVTGQWVYTNPIGEFELAACPEDVLLIASPTIEPLEIRLNLNSFKTNILLLSVSPKIKELQEVYIKRFSAKSLGIVNKDQKTYTSIERKLYAARGGDQNFYGLSSKVSFDRVLNTFSGKTKMFEKAFENEKYESNTVKLLNKLTEDFFLFTLKIEKEYLEGFLVLASEDFLIDKILQEKDLTNLKLRLVELVFKFNELNKNEK